MPQMFMLPFRPAFDSNNRTLPGAQAYFTLAGSNTKSPAYTTSGLTVAHPNPLIADGVGRFPKAYLNPSISYRVRIYPSGARVGVDTPTEEYDPYIPGSVVVGSELIEPYATAAAASAVSASSASAQADADAAMASGAAQAAQFAESQAEAAAAVVQAIAGTINFDTAGVNLPIANRGVLATAPTNIPAYLEEPGREGVFVFSSSDLSAAVASDPQQGIYIAPSSDTTGASGAWVRKFGGPAQSTWFGVSTSATASANVAAFTAALASLYALRVVGYGYNDGSIGLHTPAGHYQFNDTLTPNHALKISGDYVGSGGGTVFEWTASVHGFQLTGNSGHSNGVEVCNIFGKGNNGGTAKHFINQTGNAIVHDIQGDNWSGDIVHADSTSGGLSGSRWENVTGGLAGWTLSIDGADSNGCILRNISASGSRFGGIRDSGGIGNVCVGGVINQCGTVPGFATRCVYSGKGYAVAYGQEAGASTNAPSGSTTNNTWWIYDPLLPTVASATAPAWTSGLTWYFSAPILVEPADANVRSTFVGMYVESGLNPIVLNDPSLIVGGQILVSVIQSNGLKHGGYLRGESASLFFNNAIHVVGPFGNRFDADTHSFGPDTSPGTAQDVELRLNNWNEYSKITFNRQGSLIGQILTAGTAGISYFANAHQFYAKNGFGDTHFADLNASGFLSQVPVGYGTGAGGAVTQATSKSTGVPLNKACGSITMNNAALASAALVSFTFANSLIAADDSVRVWVKSGNATPGTYRVSAEGNASGSRTICVENRSGGSLSEALVLGFEIIRAVTS